MEFNSFLWEDPTVRGSNSPPWKRSRMAHRSDLETSRLGLNLLLSNHCHWHRLVCYVVFIGYDGGMAGYRGKRMQSAPVTTVLPVVLVWVPSLVPVRKRYRYIQYILVPVHTVPVLTEYCTTQRYGRIPTDAIGRTRPHRSRVRSQPKRRTPQPARTTGAIRTRIS